MPKMVPRREIQVYVSDLGYVCLRQADPFGEGDLVVLEPGQVLTVMRWMQDALSEAERIFTGIEQDDGQEGPDE